MRGIEECFLPSITVARWRLRKLTLNYFSSLFVCDWLWWWRSIGLRVVHMYVWLCLLSRSVFCWWSVVDCLKTQVRTKTHTRVHEHVFVINLTNTNVDFARLQFEWDKPPNNKNNKKRRPKDKRLSSCKSWAISRGSWPSERIAFMWLCRLIARLMCVCVSRYAVLTS